MSNHPSDESDQGLKAIVNSVKDHGKFLVDLIECGHSVLVLESDHERAAHRLHEVSKPDHFSVSRPNLTVRNLFNEGRARFIVYPGPNDQKIKGIRPDWVISYVGMDDELRVMAAKGAQVLLGE